MIYQKKYTKKCRNFIFVRSFTKKEPEAEFLHLGAPGSFQPAMEKFIYE